MLLFKEGLEPDVIVISRVESFVSIQYENVSTFDKAINIKIYVSNEVFPQIKQIFPNVRTMPSVHYTNNKLVLFFYGETNSDERKGEC